MYLFVDMIQFDSVLFVIKMQQYKFGIDLNIIKNVLKDKQHIDGLVQDCSNSIADALGLLLPYTKPWIW